MGEKNYSQIRFNLQKPNNDNDPDHDNNGVYSHHICTVAYFRAVKLHLHSDLFSCSKTKNYANRSGS